MKKIAAFSLILLSLAPAAGAGTLYRWVDAEGKVHYTQNPPPPNAKSVQEKKLGGSVIEGTRLPYAVQLAAKNYPVTMYTTDCGEVCAKARELLSKRGVPFTEKNAQQPAVQEELKRVLGGGLEVPVLKVGGITLRGFEESQWNNTLDAAGYPKTALSSSQSAKASATQPAGKEPGIPGQNPAPESAPAPRQPQSSY